MRKGKVVTELSKWKKLGLTMWSEEKIQDFRKEILTWYDREKRELPWRINTKAYNVWVSEIMLQQTRVDTVIPYYLRFMEEFPTIQHLAEAETDRVLKLWEGLGYYSRARNMQTAAQQIMNDFQGVFPNTIEQIRSLKGIGPYTGGAIASIAFNLPEPAIDGNVMRVVSRLFEIDADIAKASNRKVFDAVLRELIDPDRPGDFNQALMDLGATKSTPTEYVEENNPLVAFDQSFQNGTWQHYPVKTKKLKPKPVFYDAVALCNNKGEWLIEKRPEKGLLAGMWQFPLFEKEKKEKQVWKEFEEGRIHFLKSEIQKNYGLTVEIYPELIQEVTHVFSHLKWTIALFSGKSETSVLPENCQWVSTDELSSYVFPVPQQKMWQAIQNYSNKK